MARTICSFRIIYSRSFSSCFQVIFHIFQEEVRKHFNCSTLEGAELEDQGVVGTALTHWEKRVFEVYETENMNMLRTVKLLNPFS